MKTTSIIICGVGGQGILTASDLLSDLLLAAGHEVKKSEVHGMSQRGGDVISTVRFGREVFSPLARRRGCRFILAFEKLEALRNLPYLEPQGTMIVNDFKWYPLPVSVGLEKYPEDIEKNLRPYAAEVVLIPATRLALEAGNEKASNTIMLGVLAARLGIARELWLEVIRKKVPERFLELNLTAFELGFSFKETPGAD